VWNLEDRMALRLAGQLDLTAIFTNRIGLAVHLAIHLGFVKRRPAVALMHGLRAALAIAGAALRSVEFAGPGRRLRLEELLKSRLTRSSSTFTRSINRAMTARHSGAVCGSCATATPGDSTCAAFTGSICSGEVSQSNHGLATPA